MKAKSKNLLTPSLDQFYDMIHHASGNFTAPNPMDKYGYPAKTITVRFAERDDQGGRRYWIKAGCK